MLARPARIDFSSQPCSASPASKRSSMWYSWRARLFRAMVPPPFALSLPDFLLIAAIVPEIPMPIIQRSALVEHSAARMFELVNDVAAYPRRFSWCKQARVLEQGTDRVVARIALGTGALRPWFTTQNTLDQPHRIDMRPAEHRLA